LEEAVPKGTEFLEFAFLQRTAEFGRPVGHEVAFEQLRPTSYPELTKASYSIRPSTYQETPIALVLIYDDTEVYVNKETGIVTQVLKEGKDLLAAPMRPNFWRVPTDNDVPAGLATAPGAMPYLPLPTISSRKTH
jgi:beta-galactosidase